MKHILLTGFMGSGKSTLGKKLATLLGRPFVDLDGYIEEREQRKITSIFATDGEPHFRQIESAWLTDLLQRDEPHVIALGGGTVCFNNNLAQCKALGWLVYIELPVPALTERLRTGRSQRPLLNGLTETEIEQRIRQLVEAREPFYRQAHQTVKGLNLNAKILKQLIVEQAGI